MLVLSLFPGLGLLDMAFEEAGFCVVRGPDLLWGGEVKRFHPPAGRFDGVIGGPPCKAFSPLSNVVRAVHGADAVAEDLIPEFERCVAEAAPLWFLMENVRRAPLPAIEGFTTSAILLNARHVGSEQNRERRFSFGSRDGGRLRVQTDALEPIDYKPAVTTKSGGRRKVIAYDANGRVRGKQGQADDARLKWRLLGEMADDQGMPREIVAALQVHGAFTTKALRIGIGNGVPLAMGRAIAQAVKAATAIHAKAA